jgi:hypothetical protein
MASAGSIAANSVAWRWRNVGMAKMAYQQRKLLATGGVAARRKKAGGENGGSGA